MSANNSRFAELMARAYRVMVALDGLTDRDGIRAAAAAVDDGRRVCSELVEYRRTILMTKAESSALESALEFLRSRIEFFE